MARRRRRDIDWLEPIVAFVGLAVLAIVCMPDLRPIFFAVGIIALIVFAVVALGAVVFSIYRLATPERNMHTMAQMLESTDARFDPDVLELLHDTRKFCPKCERELVIRVAERGPNPGSKFWGCSGYPRCHFTMPID